jgi:hypothetical protein
MGLIDIIKSKVAETSNEIQKAIVEDFIELADCEKVSEEEFQRRISLCESCEKFNPETRRCDICTCFMDIKASLEELPFTFGNKDKKVKCSDKDNPKW